MKQYNGVEVDENLNFYNARTHKRLTPYIGTDGYVALSFKKNKGDRRNFHIRVHNVVANCFIPNPNNYKYINHIDGDKTNYSIDNLEWVTNAQNVKKGYQQNNNNYIPKNKIIIVYNDSFYKEYKSLRELAKELKLDRHKISRIIKGELRKDYYPYRFEIKTVKS